MSRREAKRRRMFRLIQQWTDSGETARAFVRRRGMKESTLWYWVRQYRGREAVEDRAPVLLPVEVRERVVVHSDRIEIELVEGVVVRVREDVAPEVVGRLIWALRRPC